MTITATPDDRERDVRAYLKKRLKTVGGELRKMSWFPRSNAPDEIVMIPRRGPIPPRGFFMELKRPGKEPNAGQVREINKLRAAGFTVLVIDSREAVDAALFW